MVSTAHEYLGSDVTAIISDSHGFGTDAILLAYFATPKRNDRICDLGTGCGIIPLLWCREPHDLLITAIDIQPSACELVEQAIELNSLQDKLEIINADLCNLKGTIPFGVFDLVTMNPPYTAANAGIKSSDDSALIARHEIKCDLSSITKTARSLLRSGGRFCLCHRPERLSDIFCVMRENLIEPKKLRLVCQRDGLAPWLVLVEGRKDGKHGLTIEPSLIIMNGSEYSDEMKKIYNAP